jgi:hypothetical protein
MEIKLDSFSYIVNWGLTHVYKYSMYEVWHKYLLAHLFKILKDRTAKVHSIFDYLDIFLLISQRNIISNNELSQIVKIISNNELSLIV